MNWEQELKQIAGNVRIKENMYAHTTFQTGGPADYFIEAESAGQIAAVSEFCHEKKIPCYVIGKGSNLLVGDKGIRGVVLHISDSMASCRITGRRIEAEAGISLAALARAALNAELSGLEFAAGIPGSLGGAVYMNAGAYGGEMKDVITEVLVMNPEGKALWIPADEMRFGYRKSRASEEGMLILAARFELQTGDPEAIREKMTDLAGRRRAKQPLEYPSAGSTFKRPEGFFAGKLIQDAGLAGYSVGGAQVSEKHCGFVINKDGATAADILKLCQSVQNIVREKFGVDLEMEVKCLGEF